MPMLRYPPESKEVDNRNHARNPALQIFGNRVHLDQTLYEYLLEFLLVFSSAKQEDGSGKLAFHTSSPLHYYVEPRNGFRRFVFYEHAKKSVRVKEDEDAYLQIREMMKRHIEGGLNDAAKETFVDSVQDLFRGYSAVLKKRSWCAQSLLPLCPEMIFCEEMPNHTHAPRKGSGSQQQDVDSPYDLAATANDTRFSCTRHNFFARGGEIYYLHLFRAIRDDEGARLDLERKLRDLLTAKSQKFSQLASWIQEIWEKDANRLAFQQFLKSIGCLRDLSDATSIVVNPYQEVTLG